MVKTQYQVVAIFRTVMLCKWGGWRWAFSRDDAKQKSLTQSLRILFYVVVIRNFLAGKVPQNLYINYPYFSTTKATSLLYFYFLFSKQNHPAFLSTTCPTFVTNDPPYYMIRKRKEWYEKTTLRFFPKKQKQECAFPNPNSHQDMF